MTKVVKDLPVVRMAIDPSDLDKYYEIPTVEIPQLVGLNVLDAEEIAFSILYFQYKFSRFRRSSWTSFNSKY